MKKQKVTKVPVIMQMEALECGAASLGMVLAYFGKWVALEQIRLDCGVSRDGSSAKNIALAARYHGLSAKGYRMEPDDLRGIAFPAVIHWNFNHFVVLCGFKKKTAVINDPARGTVEVPLEEFDKAFTGIVLRFEPTKEFVPEGKPQSVLRFAARRLTGAGSAFVFVMVTTVLLAFAGILTPLFSRVFMDEILSGKNAQWLNTFCVAMGLTVLFYAAVTAVESLYWLRMNGRFAITANAEFMWHVLRLPMDFFSQRFAGDIVARQSSNESIASSLIRQLAPLLIDGILIVVYLTVMISYSPLLTAIGVFSAAMNMAVSAWTARKTVNLNRAVQMNSGKLGAVTMSGIEMIETVKASGAEHAFFERWAGYNVKQHNAEIAIERFTASISAIPSLLSQIANFAVLLTGIYLILDGRFSIGMLAAFNGFLVSFFMPIGKISGVTQSFIGMRVQMERVEDVLRYKADVTDEKKPEGSGKLSGALEIKNVTFGYAKLSPPVVKDFSVSLSPGRSVAFVGGSGCGKSTLAKLITGLYKPWNGDILFDGKPISDIDYYTFRASVAMVDQDITLFEDTVADNIRMWDPSIEDFAVIMAARDADMHSTIVSRENGYAHRIMEGGKNFSGGQRQRLEIARVLACEPTVIILDEATSALDAKTEDMVMKNIRNIGASCIVIAHRLSTIRDCDEIIVLDKGVVVERGTHDELLKKGGHYTALVSEE